MCIKGWCLVHRMMVLRIGPKSLHLPKLIGAFIIIAAVLMFVKAGADMFESWDNVKELDYCLKNAAVSLQLQDKQLCQQNAFWAGIYVRAEQKALTNKQVWSLLAEPIAALFLWAVVLIIGVMLYLTGRIIVPVEESSKEVKELGRLKSAKRRKR